MLPREFLEILAIKEEVFEACAEQQRVARRARFQEVIQDGAIRRDASSCRDQQRLAMWLGLREKSQRPAHFQYVSGLHSEQVRCEGSFVHQVQAELEPVVPEGRGGDGIGPLNRFTVHVVRQRDKLPGYEIELLHSHHFKKEMAHLRRDPPRRRAEPGARQAAGLPRSERRHGRRGLYPPAWEDRAAGVCPASGSRGSRQYRRCRARQAGPRLPQDPGGRLRETRLPPPRSRSAVQSSPPRLARLRWRILRWIRDRRECS